MAAGAAAATAGAAHGSSGSSSLEFAQTFLAASASPAAVAAFAVLAHNKLLPVLALETESGQELPGRFSFRASSSSSKQGLVFACFTHAGLITPWMLLAKEGLLLWHHAC
jgi:hypothetical protein